MWRVVKIFAIMVILLVLTANVSAKNIKVGAVINLTGPASTWGQYHAKGLKDCFRYINEVKNGINGKKVDLTLVDHAYKVAEAAKFVKMFCTNDKMDVTVTWDAGSGIMAKPIFQKYKVPNFNISTYQGILEPPVDYVYLPFGSYIMDSYAVLEYINTIHKGKGKPKVGLLTYNNAYGKAIHAPSEAYAKKHNMEITSVEQFPTNALDLVTEVLRLKQKGVEYVFVQCLPSAIIMALQAADRIKFKAPFFGPWTSTDPDFFKRGKGVIRKRMYMQFPGCLPGDKNAGMKLMRTLWDRYKTVTSFDASYWEGVVIASLMERGCRVAEDKFKKINSETINQALETFRNENFGGLVPNVTYTKTDHSGSWKARIVRVNEDASYTPMTSFWAPGKEKVTILK